MNEPTREQLEALRGITGLDWSGVPKMKCAGMLAVYSKVRGGQLAEESFIRAVRRFFPEYDPAEPVAKTPKVIPLPGRGAWKDPEPDPEADELPEGPKLPAGIIRVNAARVHYLARFTGEVGGFAGIEIRPAPQGGAFLTATNGHRMAIFHDPGAVCDRVMILRAAKGLIQACKPGKQGARAVEVRDGQAVALDYYDSPLFIQPGECEIEGKFPDWLDIIRTHSLGRPCPAYKLEMLPEDLALFHFTGARGIRLFNTGEEKPVFVRHTDYPDFLGIIAPCKSIKEEEDTPPLTSIPDWLAPVLMKPVAA